MEHPDSKYRRSVVWGMSFNACLSCFFYSYCISVVAMPTQNILYDLDLEDGTAFYSLFVAVHYIAAGFGALVAGPLADGVGRRTGLIVSAVIGITGCLFFAFPTPVTLVLGRIITGVSAGIGSTIPPLYIKEISPPDISGRTGTCYRIMAVTGALCGFLMGLPLPIEDLASPWNAWWVVMFVFPAFILLVQVFIFLVIFRYDTPSFSAFKHERLHLTTIISAVYYPNNILPVKERLLTYFQESETEPTSSANVASKATYTEMVCDPRFRKMIVIGVSLQVTSQWSGSNAIISFSTTIFESFASVYMSRIFTVIVGVFALTASVSALFLVDKVGRISMLTYGPLALGFVLCAMGLVSYFQASQLLAMVLIALFMCVFGLTLGAVTWTYAGEILNNKGLSLVNCFSYINTFAVVYSFHFLASLGLYVAFWLYAAVCFGSFVFNSLYLIETKGLTKEEIYELVVPQTQRKATLDSLDTGVVDD
jgi:SP family sugar porter-like MFS transporter